MAARVRSRGSTVVPARVRPAGRSVRPSGHVADVQRARLVASAVRAVDELGYAGATVTDVTARSRVSRRTFYELFDNYEDCVVAVFDGAVERLRAEVLASTANGTPSGVHPAGHKRAGGLESFSWRERVRGGLWAILCFLDRDPALARVCLVQSAHGGKRMLERRERLLGALAGVVDEGRQDGDSKTDCPPLTAEGLVGAAVSILATRLSRERPESLCALHGDLMAMIVLPYLGPAAARAERKRKTPAPSSRPAGSMGGLQPRTSESALLAAGEAAPDPLRDLPIRLTYRTVRVLEAVAEQPGISNRAVGERAEVSDQGQMSKLLARLERYGLLENTGEGHTKGEANAWRLTQAGRQVVLYVIRGGEVS